MFGSGIYMLKKRLLCECGCGNREKVIANSEYKGTELIVLTKIPKEKEVIERAIKNAVVPISATRS